MAKKGGFDLRRYFIKIQRLAENLPAPRKMTAHNRMVGVRFAERPAAILHVGAEKTGGELVLEFFDPAPVGVTKEKPDHPIFENPIDKRVDDRPQARLAAELIE